MQSRLSVDALIELMYQGSLETLYMVGVAAVFTLLLGLPTGVLLVVTRPGACCPCPVSTWCWGSVSTSGGRSPSWCS